MLIRIDPTASTSLNEQMAAGARRLIVDGDVEPTVLKSCSRLRDEGLVEMRRGRGVHVAGRPAGHGALVLLARTLAEDARHDGLPADETRDLLEPLL